MKDLVVISTSPGRENWVHEILSSISRPVIVVSDFGYELGKIKWVYENTNCDRFLFLQDSLVIRDETLFDQIFEVSGSSCIMDVPACMGSYMGVYERSVLSKIKIPDISTKKESIFYEVEWTKKYIASCESFSHPLIVAHKEIETVRKFGRENLLYVNQYYEKWKGDWGVRVNNFEPYANPVELQRINLQMLEKSRELQRLTEQNLKLRSDKKSVEVKWSAEDNILNNILEQINVLQYQNMKLLGELNSKTWELFALKESTIWKIFGPYRKFLASIKGENV
jgi:hypothetical protein